MAATNVAAQPAKRAVTLELWQSSMDHVPLSKNDLNRMVLNYLVVEGYKDAAELFSKEAGIDVQVDLASIQERMNIRTAIQAGKVEEAIERVNDLDPEILDTNPRLFFHLQQQRLIEHIRSGDMMAALQFAQEEMAARGMENPEYLEDLEKTMALLAFEDGSKSPLASLMELAHRQRTASELNSAILTAQSIEKEPKLPLLLKMLAWAQGLLDEKCSYPRINDFESARLDVCP